MIPGPGIMGYDKAIAMFSPEGRLLQVEYAEAATTLGSAAVGIIFNEGILIVAERTIEMPLQKKKSVKRIFLIDDHIAATVAGYIADGRVLITYARKEAQSFRFTFNEPPSVEWVVRKICDVKQWYTQHEGVRPFGVCLMVGGIDTEGKRLFVTFPAGLFREYYARAIGGGYDAANKVLVERYKEDMGYEEALKLAIDAIIEARKSREESPEISPDMLEGMVITEKEGVWREISEDEIKKVWEGQ